jgi:hypothetical protein
MQNNYYWSSQNPYLTHHVLLRPLKVCVLCATSARRTVGPVFFNKTVNCERYVQVILGQFFPELTQEERLYGWFRKDLATAHTARISTHMHRIPTRLLNLLSHKHDRIGESNQSSLLEGPATSNLHYVHCSPHSPCWDRHH